MLMLYLCLKGATEATVLGPFFLEESKKVCLRTLFAPHDQLNQWFFPT